MTMRRRPWLLLAAGFGGLLLIMALAELGALWMISGLRSSDAQVERRFLERSQVLEQIRSAIYLSGTVARDSLLAPEGSASTQLSELTALHQRTNARLKKYERSLEPGEAEAFAGLRAEIEAYWKVLDGTFRWTTRERDKYRYQFFYTELIPRRTAMLRIADKVSQLNEQELQRGDQQLSLLFDRLRLGLIGIIALTLMGGSTLAIYTSFVILRLEKEIRTRLEETITAKTSLRELSAKLVRAQEDERRALSRELHDEAGQSFSAIMLDAENLLDLNHAAAVIGRLESIRNLAKRGLAETRNMALLLRPSMLDDFGLVPALNWQAKETAKRSGLRVQFSAEDLPQDLPEEHKTCIYRVVQEALNNVVKHAGAVSVQIRLRLSAGELDLAVQDDGAGFDATRTRGLGLLGMEERVHQLGGTLLVDSPAGRGTLVSIKLPLADLRRELAHETDSHSASR